MDRREGKAGLVRQADDAEPSVGPAFAKFEVVTDLDEFDEVPLQSCLGHLVSPFGDVAGATMFLLKIWGTPSHSFFCDPEFFAQPFSTKAANLEMR